jgi:hypothetical protein
MFIHFSAWGSGASGLLRKTFPKSWTMEERRLVSEVDLEGDLDRDQPLLRRRDSFGSVEE